MDTVCELPEITSFEDLIFIEELIIQARTVLGEKFSLPLALKEVVLCAGEEGKSTIDLLSAEL